MSDDPGGFPYYNIEGERVEANLGHDKVVEAVKAWTLTRELEV